MTNSTIKKFTADIKNNTRKWFIATEHKSKWHTLVAEIFAAFLFTLAMIWYSVLYTGSIGTAPNANNGIFAVIHQVHILNALWIGLVLYVVSKLFPKIGAHGNIFGSWVVWSRGEETAKRAAWRSFGALIGGIAAGWALFGMSQASGSWIDGTSTLGALSPRWTGFWHINGETVKMFQLDQIFGASQEHMWDWTFLFIQFFGIVFYAWSVWFGNSYITKKKMSKGKTDLSRFTLFTVVTLLTLHTTTYVLNIPRLIGPAMVTWIMGGSMNAVIGTFMQVIMIAIIYGAVVRHQRLKHVKKIKPTWFLFRTKNSPYWNEFDFKGTTELVE